MAEHFEHTSGAEFRPIPDLMPLARKLNVEWQSCDKSWQRLESPQGIEILNTNLPLSRSHGTTGWADIRMAWLSIMAGLTAGCTVLGRRAQFSGVEEVPMQTLRPIVY